MTFILTAQHVLEGARRLLPVVRRKGSRSILLGAILLTASTATVVATANTPPHFSSLTASASVIDEGQTVTLTGTFTDPDAADLHTLRIHWDQRAVPAEQIQLPAGQSSFQVTHTYTDELQPTTIAVTVYDRQTPPGSNDNTEAVSKDFQRLPIEVHNVVPKIAPGVTVTKSPTRKGFVVIEGGWKDPGADPGTVTMTTGDTLQAPGRSALPTLCAISNERHFRCEHQYKALPTPRVFPIQLKVDDGDGGVDTFSASVTIP